MPIDFTTMTSDDISRIIQMGEVELRERDLNKIRKWGLEMTNGGLLTLEDFNDPSTVGTLQENPDLIKMVRYLEECVDWEMGGREEFLDTYYDLLSQQQRKQSMKTTGA